MIEILSTLKFGLMLVAVVLGLSCIVMAAITEKSGAEALKERIEYGFLGVTGVVLALLILYTMM